MKKFLILLSLSFFVTTSFAQTATTLPDTLAATMKAMSKDLKAITAQLSDPQANANSAFLADEFVQLTLHAKNFVPDSISSLPGEQQAAAKAQFDSMLDHVSQAGVQLAAALRANDTAQASALLSQLMQAKKNGHDQFDP